MAGEGVFPKEDTNYYYGKDANMTYYQGALASTLNHASVDVNNSPTLIKALNTSRKSMLIKNNGSGTVYLGPVTVSISNGYPLLSKETIYIFTTEAIYGITATSTMDVRYLEVQ